MSEQNKRNTEEIAMRKGTPEQIAQKREEIINACEQLYNTMSFREITLKEIGKITSFSRPTIYNYFETKEEIFLALFKREYDLWNNQLAAILDQNGQLTKAQLADKIAQSLAERQQLLKLLSMNNYDMEANSRQELLTSFKQSYGCSLNQMRMLLEEVTARTWAERRSELSLYLLPLHVRHLSLHSCYREAESRHGGGRGQLRVLHCLRAHL